MVYAPKAAHELGVTIWCAHARGLRPLTSSNASQSTIARAATIFLDAHSQTLIYHMLLGFVQGRLLLDNLVEGTMVSASVAMRMSAGIAFLAMLSAFPSATWA